MSSSSKLFVTGLMVMASLVGAATPNNDVNVEWWDMFNDAQNAAVVSDIPLQDQDLIQDEFMLMATPTPTPMSSASSSSMDSSSMDSSSSSSEEDWVATLGVTFGTMTCSDSDITDANAWGKLQALFKGTVVRMGVGGITILLSYVGDPASNCGSVVLSADITIPASVAQAASITSSADLATQVTTSAESSTNGFAASMQAEYDSDTTAYGCTSCATLSTDVASISVVDNTATTTTSDDDDNTGAIVGGVVGGVAGVGLIGGGVYYMKGRGGAPPAAQTGVQMQQTGYQPGAVSV